MFESSVLYLGAMSFNVPQLLHDHYGLLITDVLPLAGEVDLNFRVTDDQKNQYTLKVSQPGSDPKAIAFERAIMVHLAANTAGPNTPSPVGEAVELSKGRVLRLQSWLSGRPLSSVNPFTSLLRRQWGKTLGQLTLALRGFEHPDAPTDYKWNPSQTLGCRHLALHFNDRERELANFFWNRFERETLPALPTLAQSIVYADGHGDNLLVDPEGNISGVIDFGDAMRTHTINELAIGCAYAGMGVPDPIRAMAEVVAGYSSLGHEVDNTHLLNLITARLLITVSVAAENARKEPENEYLQISAAPAWALLAKLRDVPPALALACFRTAAGLAAHPYIANFEAWAGKAKFTPVIKLQDRAIIALDLSVGSLDLGGNRNFEDLPAFSRHIRRWLEDKDADFGIGGYGEVRPVYTTDDFATEGNDGPRWRTTHLGLDVWGPAGTPVYAPYPGQVHSLGIDPTAGGYGAVIILAHETDEGRPFFTLYGHLSADSLSPFSAGTQVRSGDEIARFGHEQENGGWPPHLHFQVMLDMLGYSGDFPGVAYPEDAKTWLGLCPNPYPFMGLDRSLQQKDQLPKQGLIDRRKVHLGRSLSVSYAEPLHILRGNGQYLYDETGRRFLDTVNNVAHVGHEHPAVVEAIQRQAAVLNTNSRYLHDQIILFAEELKATMPEELSVVHFVNSGSEANELALRMCEAWSGSRNMLAVEVGYHGNTGRTIDVSSYKFDGKGGQGAPPQTTIVPAPDVFRGLHRDRETAGINYSEYITQAIENAESQGKRFGGFLAESILSCGGQIVLPDAYLQKVYAAVRAHGGLCVADEVQVGLGRVGSHWWGFELQGVVPDIVTIGKPLGNGHPLGAVVCTPAVATAFANGMEYFNTFGGNPVSCTAGRAVLRTVREEGLREHAKITGEYLKTLLSQLQGQHPIIGDVRGEGLFLGFELVRPNLAPATAPAKYLKNRMRQLGFLMSTDGPDENVIKIKPPLCFDRRNADQLVGYLGKVLGEDKMRRG